MSVAAALSGLASVVRDFGVSEYSIRKRNWIKEKIRAAYSVNILVSWLVAFRCSAVAFSLLPHEEPGIGEVIRIRH